MMPDQVHACWSMIINQCFTKKKTCQGKWQLDYCKENHALASSMLDIGHSCLFAFSKLSKIEKKGTSILKYSSGLIARDSESK